MNFQDILLIISSVCVVFYFGTLFISKSKQRKKGSSDRSSKEVSSDE